MLPANQDLSHTFAALGDLFRPGPTGTNVMDLEIAIVGHVAGRDAAC